MQSATQEGRKFPVVFVGHGTPLNAIDDNVYTRGWAALARMVPRPRAILCVSAHWYTRGTGVTAMAKPRTVYDFGYRNLQHLIYPAPGDPALAEEVANLLSPIEVARDQSWGFDHGTWSVLLKAYPAADIPVVQLSMDGTKPPQFHYEVGHRLAPLRERNVLIFATGNIVHNLEHMIRAPGGAPPFPWAERFDHLVRDKLVERDWDALVDYEMLGMDAAQAVPTPDHYLPLVYAMGAADPREPVSFPIEGIAGGSMSMRSVLFGQALDGGSRSPP
jgi:4,5-DOPA dioxygenase extradiol